MKRALLALVLASCVSEGTQTSEATDEVLAAPQTGCVFFGDCYLFNQSSPEERNRLCSQDCGGQAICALSIVGTCQVVNGQVATESCHYTGRCEFSSGAK
jgi:hypothetical protein